MMLFVLGIMPELLMAQTITNGNFEDGTLPSGPNSVQTNVANWDSGCSQHYNGSTNSYYQGTPDVFDCASPGPYTDMPAQNKLNPGANNGCRFVGMLTPESDLERNESIIQNTGVWTDGISYTLSMSVARVKWVPYDDQPVTRQLEAVLRKAGNCTDELVIPIYTDIPINNNGNGTPSTATNNWMQISTTFSLGPADAAQNYDHLEIRPRYTGTDFYEMMFVDNIALEKEEGSTAEIAPLNHTGVETMGSIYGNQSVYTFCTDDVLLNGLGSENESTYRYELSEINLSTFAQTLIYKTTMATGTVPTNIDAANGGGLPLAVGAPAVFDPLKVYILTLYVGPQWHYDQILFTVEDCCPEGLVLEQDCDEGLLVVNNIPDGAQGVQTTWYYSKKTPGVGYGQVISHDNGIVSTLQPTEIGYYTVVIEFMLSNGETCTYTATIYYSPAGCCERKNDIELSGQCLNTPDGVREITTKQGWKMRLPVFCLDTHETIDFQIDAQCEEYYAYYVSEFDVVNWVDIGPKIGHNNYPSGTWGQIPSQLNYLDNNFVSGKWYHFNIFAQYGFASYDFVFYYQCDVDSREKTDNSFKDSVFDIKLAPNPANNEVTVSLNKRQTGEVSIVSVDGRILFNERFNNQQQIAINVIDLPSGLYWVKVNVGNQVSIEKLIKR